MVRTALHNAAVLAITAIALLPFVQTFSAPACGHTFGRDVAQRPARTHGACAWSMRSSSHERKGKKPGEREDHGDREPVNPRYAYVGGGYQELSVPTNKGNASMYSAFDSALRASDYNMFCSPLKPVQAPVAFRSASRDVYLTESKAAQLEKDFLEEQDPEEVARKVAADYAEFDRLVGTSGIDADGEMKLMHGRKRAAVRKQREVNIERSPSPAAKVVEALTTTVEDKLKSPAARSKGRVVQGGLAGLSDLVQDDEESEDADVGYSAGGKATSTESKERRRLQLEEMREEGYDELQKLLGVKPRPGARTRLDDSFLKGNMTAHKQSGIMKKVIINDPLRRVYAQRLMHLEPDIGSPEAISRPARNPSPQRKGEPEEGAATSFVADTLQALKSGGRESASTPAAAPPRSPKARSESTGRERESKKAGPASPKMGEAGRVVLNHSTHVEGLIPVLKRLIEVQGISTVVPGRLFTAQGRQHKLTLRVTVPTDDGFKLVARLGQQTQEVFVVCDLDQETLEAAIAWSL